MSVICGSSYVNALIDRRWGRCARGARLRSETHTIQVRVEPMSRLLQYRVSWTRRKKFLLRRLCDKQVAGSLRLRTTRGTEFARRNRHMAQLTQKVKNTLDEG